MAQLDDNYYCVIMAGGIGSRFWPKSRTSYPKQFLDILGVGRSLLQQTFDRFAKICKPENIFVVTGEAYEKIVSEQLPELSNNNILVEPLRRNTAPCIAYASYKIMAINPNANIVVSPADHYIGDERGFEETIIRGLQFTQFSDSLLTIGIIPTRPETGYGYIQIDSKLGENPLAVHEVTKVKLFTEKPDLEMAKAFLESKEFFWNSGIFIWNVKTIVNAFRELQPGIDEQFSQGWDFYNTDKEREFINSIYPECQNISIDYGIMESHQSVYVIPALFQWSDLGTWGSLYENSKRDQAGNAVAGSKVILNNTTGCIINTDERLVVVDGLKDYIIAQSDGLLLIVPKSNEQNIKNIVNAVKVQFGDNFV
ncbi:MAG: mannose-1-phosphate guanylyltransferase [Bacteroidales bacterium]|nr:mannose-1-phosphate guanylyltransferase [Bacteroidales bacterium]